MSSGVTPGAIGRPNALTRSSTAPRVAQSRSTFAYVSAQSSDSTTCATHPGHACIDVQHSTARSMPAEDAADPAESRSTWQPVGEDVADAAVGGA